VAVARRWLRVVGSEAGRRRRCRSGGGGHPVGGVGGRGKRRQWLGRAGLCGGAEGGRGGAGRRGGVGAVSRGWWWRSAAAVLERRKKGEDRKPDEEERKGKEKTSFPIFESTHPSMPQDFRRLRIGEDRMESSDPVRRRRIFSFRSRAAALPPLSARASPAPATPPTRTTPLSSSPRAGSADKLAGEEECAAQDPASLGSSVPRLASCFAEAEATAVRSRE
jgi:hypothetical protein